MLGSASVAVKDAASSTCFGEEAGPPLPVLEFPAGNSPPVVQVTVTSEKCEHSARTCIQLLARARQSTPAVLGFDIEWSLRPSGPRRQVATLQLSALDGYTVLFHLKPQECKPGIMPTALKELLLNTTVQLVRIVCVRGYIHGRRCRSLLFILVQVL